MTSLEEFDRLTKDFWNKHKEDRSIFWESVNGERRYIAVPDAKLTAAKLMAHPDTPHYLRGERSEHVFHEDGTIEIKKAGLKRHRVYRK